MWLSIHGKILLNYTNLFVALLIKTYSAVRVRMKKLYNFSEPILTNLLLKYVSPQGLDEFKDKIGSDDPSG